MDWKRVEGKLEANERDHNPPWRTFAEFCDGRLRSLCFECHQTDARAEQRKGFAPGVDPATRLSD